MGALQPHPVVALLHPKQKHAAWGLHHVLRCSRVGARLYRFLSLFLNLLSFLEILMRFQNNPKRKVLFFFCLKSSKRDSGTRRTGVFNCLVCLPRHLRGRPGVNVLGEQMRETLPSVPGTRLGVRSLDRCKIPCQDVQRRRSRIQKTK